VVVYGINHKITNQGEVAALIRSHMTVVSLTFSARGQLVFTGGKKEEKLSTRWSNQPGKIVLTTGQFAWCLALNETHDMNGLMPLERTIKQTTETVPLAPKQQQLLTSKKSYKLMRAATLLKLLVGQLN